VPRTELLLDLTVLPFSGPRRKADRARAHPAIIAFQTATQTRLAAAVERLSGREVLRFASTHHVGPDLEVEVFALGPNLARSPPHRAQVRPPECR
jgi:hypothetical protein